MYDLLIRDGRILDGTGAPWFRGDLAVVGETIVAMGDLKDCEAERTVDAVENFVVPGFVEEHSHADTTFLVDPLAQSAVRQGITTMAVGCCGMSAAPLSPEARGQYRQTTSFLSFEGHDWSWHTMGEYLDALRTARPSVNVVAFAGHIPLRTSVMKDPNRPADQKEIAAMRAMLERALAEGARGFTTGLTYKSCIFSETEEIIELAKALHPFGWAYHTHLRDYGAKIFEAIQEAIRIAETAGVPLVISHMYPSGRNHWGKSARCIELVEEARRRGVDVGFDVTPWLRGGGPFEQLLPPWIRRHGMLEAVEQLKDADVRKRLAKDLQTGDWPGWEPPEWDQALICRVNKEKNLGYMGRSIAEVADVRGLSPAEMAVVLFVEDEGQFWIAPQNKCDEDVDRLLGHPLGVPIADGFALAPEGPLAHKDRPNSYGTFPRVLGRYVRERGVLTWQQAVQKMTSLPARRLGLWDRGILRPGMKADIVIFDPQTVIERADYTHPQEYPEGVQWVIVNGHPTVNPKCHTGAQEGQVL